MNPPNTDPFYDALRNRLHDYEEPLPAGGWAGIASQLPPAAPAPLPSWRRRIARRRNVLLLLLLLLLPTALLLRQQLVPAGRSVAGAEPANPAGRRRGAAALTDPAGARATAPLATMPVEPARPGAKAAETGSSAASPGARAAALPAPHRRLRRLPPAVAAAPAADPESEAPGAVARPGATADERPKRRRSGRSSWLLAAEPARPRATVPGLGEAPATTSAPTSPPALARAHSRVVTGQPAAAPASPELAAGPGSTTGAALTAGQPAPQPEPTEPAEPAPGAASASVTPSAATPPAPAEAVELAALTGRTASLAVAAFQELPTPLPLTAPADSLRRPRPARLSLGLLLGLTPTRRGAGSAPAALRRAEQPGLGSTAELAARYQLGRGLSLRSGVGYAVQRQQVAFTLEKRQSYWARTSQLVVRPNPGGPDTLQVLGYTRRDTVLGRQHQQYRLAQHYLSLPLAGEWRPRTPFRWQPVLSLGATVNWLLQGRYLATTDAGCHCEIQTQRAGGRGPFRPSSVALSAGLGLDYALGLRTTLLLRPTAAYWLNGTSRSGQRRPVALGLQVGVLFDTRR